jgi:histidine triad (HIT) family protein
MKESIGLVQFLRRSLFAFARTKLGAALVGFVFNKMDFLLPVHRLGETSTLLAFNHPQPAYPLHILIVPRQAVRSFQEMKAEEGLFWRDFVQVVQDLVLEFGLEERGYRLILNGGKYQEIPQLHFHLISET